MERLFVKELPVDVNVQMLMNKMKLDLDSPVYQEYLNAMDILNERIKPMAIVKACSVETVSKHMVLIDGVKYKSKTLHYLLKDQQRVFIYLLTIGEMPADLHHIQQYFINSLKLPMMYGAMKHLKQAIRKEYHFDKIGIANPGLIPDWPIQEIKTIFDSLGQGPEQIGIRMGNNFVMRPVYSSSGILFEDVQNYCDCAVCGIDGCIAREANLMDVEEKLARIC